MANSKISVSPFDGMGKRAKKAADEFIARQKIKQEEQKLEEEQQQK